MNLGQLRTSLQGKGYGSDTASAQTAALNAAYRRVVGGRHWPWLQRLSTSLTTSVSNPSVPLTTITDLMWVSAVRIEIGSEFYDLIPLEEEEFRSREYQDRQPSVPEYWTEVFGEIRLYPRPDRVYTIALDYYTTPPDLVNDVDVPLFDSTFHDVLVWGALSDMAFRERDFAAYQMADRMFDARLLEMQRSYGLGQRHKSKHVQRSAFWDQVGRGSGGWGR